MPVATYENLLLEALPKVIKTEEQYDECLNRVSTLVRKSKDRTPDETELMQLLSILIEDYDRKQEFSIEDNKPHEILKFLFDEHGMKLDDLSSVFGQKSHVSEALSGKRPISVTQAHKLASIFSVKHKLFL